MATPTEYFRYVAIGDSSTEGLEDPLPNGEYRGWANRFAEHVAAAQSTPLLYANLAVRGRKTHEVRNEQLAPALAMQPDIATVFAGVNDVARFTCDVHGVAADLEHMLGALRSTGATVLTITMPDLSANVPLARLMRDRLLALNQLVRDAANRTGALCVDLASYDITTDLRLWHPDRLHANSEGHRRIAGALASAVSIDAEEGHWADPLPAKPAPGPIDRLNAEVAWARDFFLPWAWRHARGISSGDKRAAKRPNLTPVSPLKPTP
ncbi:MAG: SGNH/GDSL hydrolase family protein [Gemmatimonadetes bacterium]|nr:SGNH/GDSL hydrolase family protein [Gemmatimonadota bacterium]